MAKQDAQNSEQDAQNSKIADSLAVLQSASQQTQDSIKRIDSSLSQTQDDINTMNRDIDANANKSAPRKKVPQHKPDRLTKTRNRSRGQRKLRRSRDRWQEMMHLRPHHCRIETLAETILTTPMTKYCNSGLGIQLYRETMAGMQTNEQTSGFKYTRAHSGKMLWR